MFKKAGKSILFAVLTVALSFGLGYYTVKTTQTIWKAVRSSSAHMLDTGERAIGLIKDAKEAGAELADTISAKQITFLLTGIDNALGGSDVMMLASLDTESGSVRVVQIPRDTYINRPDSENHKLNSIYAVAAARAKLQGQSADAAAHTANRALRAFLQTNLGVKIDHYVSINTAGLRAIVDAIGGVPVNVPMDIDYDDNSQNLHIHLKAGEQTLDGAKAEQFVRFRSGYLTADYGRMDAQKIFLSAFFHKIKSDFSLPAVIKLATSCLTHTRSDLSAADLIPLIKCALQVKEENVKMITLKGQAVKDERGILCEVLSKQYAIDLLTDYLLPRGGKSTDLVFDPNGVFTAPGEIDRIYNSTPPYDRSGIAASESDRIKIR
jgi:LCP family protein required for cell wall assembly